MNSAICRDDRRRRAAVRGLTDEHGERSLNGLDYVEVDDDQRTLYAYFLGKLPRRLRKDRTGLLRHVRIEGGRRIRDLKIESVEPHADKDPDRDDYLTVRVNKPGDFSTYTLRLVDLPGIDPRYDHLDFSFKVNCPSDLDCAANDACPPATFNEPEINYLAKDYASFRQLIFDRLALIMPAWRERHAPDIGVALVEVLAYVGDYLSYYQDAVATEAYLDTARQRISVRRHARLVDYTMHEGCNARALVSIDTDTELPYSAAEFYFVTRLQDSLLASRTVLAEVELNNLTAASYEVFEPLVADREAPLNFRPAHSEMHFYTWGAADCCLPRGATTATIEDAWIDAGEPAPPPSTARRGGGAPPPPPPPASRFKRKLDLREGDLLIFEQVIDPKSALTYDADPTHRHAVRVTKIELAEDPVVRQTHRVGEVEVDLPTPVVEITWAEEDRLPIPFCLSVLGPPPDCRMLERVSVVRGNVVLVDHGRTVYPPERLGVVPTASSEARCEDVCTPGEIRPIPGPFKPHLARRPLTFRQLLPGDDRAAGKIVSARRLLTQEAREALPQITLTAIPAASPGGESQAELVAMIEAGLRPDLPQWTPRPDLLGSGGDDRHFVAELDNDGLAHLRFGDGELGEQPPAGALFYAHYRVGNGSQGNVGAETIAHLILREETLSGALVTVRNPLPAQGGVDAEPMTEVKLLAPAAFRQVMARAITGADYARLAEGNPHVQRAAAELTWTGSWYEADVAIDPLGGEADQMLRDAVGALLHPYRRIGHDLAVHPTRYVALDIALTVCVLPSHLRGHVKTALQDLFSNRLLPGGKRGLFHSDNLSFGEGIYLSKLVAVAQSAPGVESVRVTRLQRQFEAANHELENGYLPIGPLEIARLDNDPSFPEQGKLELIMLVGR